MKLVTGIEAIQSGKPFRHKDADGWLDVTDKTTHFSIPLLLKKEFIIKEEPREFLIDMNKPDCLRAFRSDHFGTDAGGENWIRVREIEK